MIRFIISRNNKNLVGVEIGTAEGGNAKNMLDFLSIKKLYLVDPWLPYDGYVTDKTYSKAKKTLSDYSDKLEYIQKTSEEAVNFVPNDIDFIYIDGNHSYDFVKKDIELYYPKVKKGGIIGGHDFCADYLGVCTAVIEFVQKNNLKLNTADRDWWIVK
jgi:hypothetical protein